MYQIITEDHLNEAPEYRAAFDALPKGDATHVVVKLAPGDWAQAFHHDLNGALRSFHYLADKARASYEEGDPRGAKVLASIEKHLKTMETLKAELIDRILPWEK